MIDPASISLGLLDALEEFDKSTPPLGLYACEELLPPSPRPNYHPEWTLCLKPYLKQLDASLSSGEIRQGSVAFHLPGGTEVSLRLLRTSKVKVRKFGSRYRVDPHNKYEERWRELQLEQHLRQLWKYNWRRVLLFIGFDRAAEPFEEELASLSATTRWEKRNIGYLTRTWPDRYERSFSVRLCAWFHPAGDAAEQATEE